MQSFINPEKSYIFRITHINNIRWILENGLCCRNSLLHCPDYVEIGKKDLIQCRKDRRVLIPPGGTLSDYIPFYFTPFTPMLFNIKTGKNVMKRPMSEIVIMVASLRRLAEGGMQFVFTDRHAFVETAQFSNEIADLDKLVPWDLLNSKDFRRDPEHPDKVERYQAEALIHRHLPVDNLRGIVVYDEKAQDTIQEMMNNSGMNLRVSAQPDWYL